MYNFAETVPTAFSVPVLLEIAVVEVNPKGTPPADGRLPPAADGAIKNSPWFVSRNFGWNGSVGHNWYK